MIGEILLSLGVIWGQSETPRTSQHSMVLGGFWGVSSQEDAESLSDS